MMMSEEDFCDLIASWLPPDGRVLDVGCGRGRMLLALEQRGITGMGIDPYADEGSSCRRLRAEEMGQLGRSFDLVYTRYALHHFPHPEDFPEHAREALKSRGILVIVDWVEGARTGLPESYLVSEDLIRWVRAAGLGVLQKKMLQRIMTIVVVATVAPLKQASPGKANAEPYIPR